MSSKENEALARRIADELFRRGDLAVADELVAPNYVEHVPLPPGWPPELAGLKQYVAMLRRAFPDVRYTVEDLVAEEDKVALHLTARGTHQAEFMGIPPSGRQATWTEVHVARIAGGKLVEHWALLDQFGLLRQLGASQARGRVTSR